MTKCFFAIDLGATSGRTIVGYFTPQGLVTEEINRFPNYLIEIGKHFYWDIYELYRNIIEGLNRQFRQITKNKPSFTNDDSLRKMLYLASQKIVERWTQRCRNWDVVLSQLSIIFEDRIPA